jgi:hypothetical protein
MILASDDSINFDSGPVYPRKTTDQEHANFVLGDDSKEPLQQTEGTDRKTDVGAPLQQAPLFQRPCRFSIY